MERSDAGVDTALIGTWISDPEDRDGISELGSITMDFESDGQLTYTVHGRDKDQKMYLTFRVENGMLVTNQPAAPREEKTAYSITPEGKLVLWFGGNRSSYVRDPDA